LDDSKIAHLVHAGVITDGMIVKVKAAQEASKTLGKAVRIGSWNDLGILVSDPLKNMGTTIASTTISA
jgi:acetylglutamate kinase